MDLLPGAVETNAVEKLEGLLGESVEVVLAHGGLDAPTLTAEAQLAVALGRALAPIDLTLALLIEPRDRVALAVPRPAGGHACIRPDGSDVVLVWDDDGIAVANGFDATEVIECLDPATPMVLGTATDIGSPVAANATRATLHVAGVCAGLARGALDMAVAYATTREQFGRPIGANQAVKHLCADAATRAEAAWASVNYASVSFADGRDDSEFRVAVAARVALDAAIANGRTNIQVHGGRGYTLDGPAAGFLLRARVLEQLLGGARRARRTILGQSSL